MSFIGNQPKFSNVTTRAQSADPAVPVEGMLFYADGTSRTRGLWQYIQGSWQQVGASSGGLDVAFQLVANESLSDWSNGNNATFLGGGALAGTFVKNTSSPLNGVANYRYTQAAGSLNDYIASAAQPIPVKFRGNIATVFFNYQYDGGNSDMEFVVWDVTNSQKLTLPANSLVPVPIQTTGLYRVNISIPATCASIRIGFQTKILNSGKILNFDDIVLTSDATVYADLDNDSPWASYTPTFTGFGTATAIEFQWRQSGQNVDIRGKFVAGTPTATEARISLPSALTSANTSIIPSLQVVGSGAFSGAVAASVTSLIEPSVTYLTFGRQDGATGGLTKLNGSALLGAGSTFSFFASVPCAGLVATVPSIVTQSESFSTDTASLVYAGSATYTLTTLADAPIGTFITFTYASTSNTRTQTTTAPTQTTASMNVNGIQLFTRAYNAASTAAQPAVVAIQIGKGMKGVTLDLYKSLGKVTSGELDNIILSSTTEAGAYYKSYNEVTGILTVDVGYNLNTTTTTKFLGYTDLTSTSNGYLVINASRNPSLTGLNIPQLPTIQKFTSGSGTYTRPAGVRYINVKMVGGGGGGGGSGTAAGGNGGAGGDTTFGSSLLVANGGGGGAFSAGTGGTGGAASLGTGPIGTSIQGGVGSGGSVNPNTAVNAIRLPAGTGASSPFGGQGSWRYDGAGSAAIANSGSGGGGGSAGTVASSFCGSGGGAGGYVDAIINNPATTYSYAIGAAGAAGTAGTSGLAGGAGGSGYIIVTEYYY